MGEKASLCMTNSVFRRSVGQRFGAASVALAGALLLATPSVAKELSFGPLSGSFDSTIGWGMIVRTESNQDLSQSGSLGRRALFQHAGDIVSNQISAGHELEMSATDWGFFIRGNYFYDFEMANQPLPEAAENRAVHHGDITDAFLWKRFGPVTLRGGKQVISWGESFFNVAGINDINTYNFANLRSPGSALKDAFIGSQALHGSWEVNDSMSLEAFYLLEYQEILLDPAGSFFSTNDRIRDGGGFANGARSTAGRLYDNAATFDGGRSSFGPITRLADDLPGGSGGWGIAAHFFLPDFLTGLDIGLFYQSLDDHAQYLSTIVGGTPCNFGTGFNGLCPRFFLDTPESIERFGISVNTNIAGWAVGSELVLKRNAPTQNYLTFSASVAGMPALSSSVAQGFPNPFLGAATPAMYGGAGAEFEGFERYRHWQWLLGVQRIFGPVYALGADGSGVIAELSVGWARDLPNQSPTFTRFNPTSRDWESIVVRYNIDWSRALFNLVNIRVAPAVQYDWHGVSPEVSPIFIEGRVRASLGVNFDWLNNHTLSLSQNWEIDGDDVRRDVSPFSNGSQLARPEGDFFKINYTYNF